MGSIIAVAHHFRAEAVGLGYTMQDKRYLDVDLTVNGDIKAIAYGDSLFDKPYGYSFNPLIASAAGHDLHHLELSLIHI